MSDVTAAELALLRTHPQETTLYLSIYKPPVIMTAEVNDSGIAPGARLITYNALYPPGANVNVEEGMVMYVGTSPGAKDVGKIRVRSASATVITVAENSDIEWSNGLYLTIVEFWEIDAVYPRVISSGTSTFWYKDYDVEYNSQNDELGMFICMGGHYAGFKGEVYLTATGTVSLMGNNLSYSWVLPGSDIGTSLSLTPGTVHYNTPGHYTIRLTVSDQSTNVEDSSYRHISIYDRPGEGKDVPILNWELVSLDGSRDMGGYQGRIKIRESTSDVVDGSLVVIFADDKYGNTAQSIGGNGDHRQKIVFVGYILDGSISYNYQEGSVEFTIGSPTEVMKLTEGFGVALNSSTNPTVQAASDNDIPSAWVLMLNMDCRRALYHYLRWHSTVLFTNDFQFMGTDRAIQFFDADRESLFDAVNNLMNGTLYGNLVSDRQGKLWAEVGIAATPNAGNPGVFPEILDMGDSDWIGSPAIEELYNDRISYLEMGGIAYTSASGTSSAYLSCAPGTAPAYRGSVQKFEGLALADQDQLNTLCGNVFAYLNSRYAHVSLDLAGNYRNIDIAPQEIITLTMQATDTPKGIAWTKKKFHPTEMSWVYDPRKGTFLPSLVLHEVTQGFSAATIVIPPIPPTTDPRGGNYDNPPLPPYPPYPPFPPNTFYIYVYHNGILVGKAAALNFVDSA